MTEQDWLTSCDPGAMLKFLNSSLQCKHPSDRQLRLFAWACYLSFHCYPGSGREHEQASETVATPPHAGSTAYDDARYWCGEMNVAEQPKRAAFLRDIIGNPWQPVVLPVVSYWSVVTGREPTVGCPWLTPPVLGMAQTIYDTGRFEDMPILWDALEEAGCEDEGIRDHCLYRVPPHVRGCWVLDLLRGAE